VVFGKCDNSLDTHLGKHKNLIFNIVCQMAKNHWILPTHSNNQQSWLHFSWTTQGLYMFMGNILYLRPR